MDKEPLIAKRDAIKNAFDDQVKIKAQAEEEILRLQGEYRVITELIDEPKKEKK